MKTLKEIQTLYTDGAELSVFDKTLQVSAQRNCYTQLYKKYRGIADSVYENYLPIDESYKNIEELIGDVPRPFWQLINIGVEEVVKDAFSVGLNEINAQTVKEQCKEGYFSPFFNAYNAIKTAYEDINDDINDTESEIFSAVGGIEEAAVIFKSAVYEKSGKQEIQKLFFNDKLRSDLREGFRKSCLNLHYYIINTFSKKSSFRMSGFPDKESIEKAAGIYYNLLHAELSSEQKKAFICDILELNPYKDSYYVSFSEIFPENTAQFMKLSEFFGTSALKARLNEMLTEFVGNNIGTTEEDAYQCRNLLDKKVAEFGMDCNSAAPTYRIVEERLAQLDLEYRTVQGVVLDTREAADTARNDIESHKDILENPPQFIYRRDYTDYIEKINNLPIRPEISAEYAKRYSEKLEEFDRQSRKAIRYHCITTHHNPFWNGDKNDMLKHYGIAAVLLLLGISFMISKGAPGFVVLAVGMLVYTVVIKPFLEKKVWQTLTHNGKYKMEDIVAGSPVLDDFKF